MLVAGINTMGSYLIRRMKNKTQLNVKEKANNYKTKIVVITKIQTLISLVYFDITHSRRVSVAVRQYCVHI